MQFPGCVAIGAGFYNATMWLNYRGQKLGMNIRQSSLHLYEATRMASSAPSVNDHLDALVATKDWACEFSTRKDADEGSPVSLKELRALAKRFGPRKTAALATKVSTLPNPQSTTAGR
jgi:hypothetical protein